MLDKIISNLKKCISIFSFNENLLKYINGGEVLPQPYSTEEEAEMIAKLSSGESEIKNNLIEHNLRLVVYIARRFENTGVDLDDLVSVGTIGLIKAVSSFNVDKNIKLANGGNSNELGLNLPVQGENNTTKQAATIAMTSIDDLLMESF